MTVYLLGAGPGDPGLLTVRGAEVLASADVVIYDRLSVALLLDLAPESAERISVGKEPGRPSVTQDDINELIVEHGRSGKSVVRLKGGDPFVFARGGEEARALIEAGVDFEVIPGITSAIAAPAYAGIPVTLRHSSTSLTIVTGHEDPTNARQVDWDAVAAVGGTIVVLMGVGRWPRIADRLLAAGRPPDTPAAAVRWGTRPEQQTVRATLATLADHPLESPSVIVVGDVAGEDLRWFESRPLFGRRLVVTRARAQASVLVETLRRLGADPIEAPMIRIDDPDDDGAALRDAVAHIADYDWVVLTSPNGADRFLAEVPDARRLAGLRVAAIGPGTANRLAQGHILADLVPDRFVAEALLEVFPAPHDGGRILIARAAVARNILPDGLRDAGWSVDVVDAYRTSASEIGSGMASDMSDADAVLFTSSSTVTNYVAAVGTDATPPVVACIGPITAATAREHGLDVVVEAPVHTIDGLVEAVVEHFGPSGRIVAP